VNTPPPVIAGTYVVSYAYADQSVNFVQRNTLSVNGEWLGRVPYLAICQDFESLEYFVQHCDETWEPLGIAGGYRTVEEARRAIERSYNGITSKWIDSTTTKDAALAHHRADLKAASCSFCGRNPLEVSSMIGDEVRICNYCVESFHKAL
jgi:hypothetical protein